MSSVTLCDVKKDEEGMRLDRWFRLHYPDLTHGRLQKLLRSGQIRIDGARVKANTRLAIGQKIRIPPLPQERKTKPPKKDLAPEDIAFAQGLVIHRDAFVIALNKPPGLAVQGGTRMDRHLDGLLDGLKFDFDERPRLVHRLDKDTSGVLLLARTRDAASKLGQALKHRSAEKIYWALVMGVPRHAAGTINLPLIKKGGQGDERVRIADLQESAAQKAETDYAIVDIAGQKFAWLVMRPVTGRTHQLRVHANAIGHPIVGDGKYGGADAHPGGEIPQVLHLHATTISIPHPNGGKLKVSAPLPQHMLKTWELLNFDSRAEVSLPDKLKS